MTLKEQQKKEYKKLCDKYSNGIDDNYKNMVMTLCESLAWYNVAINNLQKDIETEGNIIANKANPKVNILSTYNKIKIGIFAQLDKMSKPKKIKTNDNVIGFVKNVNDARKKYEK